MNKGRKTALVILISTILAGAYTATRVFAPDVSSQASATDTPTGTLAYEGCAFVWAYRQMPEFSTQFDLAVKELFPIGSGRVQAFGEDCLYADGRTEFSAKESDFYVTLPVPDLTDEQALGDRMAAIMTVVIERFPSDSLPGGHNGFVEFVFEQSEADFLVLRVPIQEYKNDGVGKAGMELFRMFHQVP
jgi:hypothetical protein